MKVVYLIKSTFLVTIFAIFMVANFPGSTNAVAAPANPALVNGYTVSRVVFGQSLLEQVETGKWVEKSVSDGAPLSNFEEKFRTANTVSMIDKTRSLGVLIDVASKQASWFPISDPKQLNFIAAVSSATVDISYVTEVAFNGGLFRKVGPKDWIEEGADGKATFTFKEESSTDDTLTLFDSSNKKLHLNIADKSIKLSWAPYTSKDPLYDITSIGTTPHVVYRFAPELRFDRAAKGYPMSAQQYYDKIPTILSDLNNRNVTTKVENLDKASLKSRTIPTYFQYAKFGNQVRIKYWWFYGYQDPCLDIDAEDIGTAAGAVAGHGAGPVGVAGGAAAGKLVGGAIADWTGDVIKGAHYGDWEQVMVTLTEGQDAVASVTFYQHAGWYTRIAGPRDAPCTAVGRCEGFSGFRRNGERPVVYVGKVAHGSFHYDKSSGLGNVTGAKCLYFEDYRNPAGDADYFPTHTSTLVDLGTDKEGWNAAIGDQKFMWGPGPETGRYDSAISTNPRLDPPVRRSAGLQGKRTFIVGKDRRMLPVRMPGGRRPARRAVPQGMQARLHEYRPHLLQIPLWQLWQARRGQSLQPRLHHSDGRCRAVAPPLQGSG